MDLPRFKYHPDPLRSGSVEPSSKKCECCKQARGFIYVGPVYAADGDLEDALCPWCIADGSANEKFDVEFIDSEAFADGIPQEAMDEITFRTPGYSAWQAEQWPACCDDATYFVMPAGLTEIRANFRELEGELMGHIVHEMQISGGAATRLLNSLHRDNGPTAYIFHCLKCHRYHYFIDQK